MTAGRIGADGFGSPHGGARVSRRAAMASAALIIGLAATLAVTLLVAENGIPSAAVPAAVAPTVVVPAAAAPSVAAPSVVSPAPAIAPATVDRPSGPIRVPGQRIPVQPGFRTSWGRFAY